MSKKVLLIVSGIVMLIASSLYYISYSSSKSSAKPTYAIPKKSSTYHFQKLADNPALPAAGTWQNDFPNVNNNNVLGIAGQFNFFAKNINSRQNNNGNFATGKLTTGSWRTNGTEDKISYIQNEFGVENDSRLHASKLVLGNKLDFNNNNTAINGYTLNEKPSGFTQDKSSSKYIDFDSEFTRLSGNSITIARNSKDNKPIISGDQWNRTFDATNITSQNDVKYLTIKASDMPSGNKLDIKGVADNQKIVLTIDTSGLSDFSSGWLVVNKNILFNFYNIANNTPYAGNIEWMPTTNETSAVLAPNAIVELKSGAAFKGNIIANTINIASGNSNTDNYPDVPVPQNPDDSGTTAPTNPQLTDVPSVDFGSHELNRVNSQIGDWKGDFRVINGTKQKEITINVKLTKQFTSQTGVIANGVTWQLIKSDYNSSTLVSSSQDLTNSPATISYWPWQDDGVGNILGDWNHNKKDKSNGFYDMQISNLESVTEPGDYTATLKWQLADVP